MDTYIYTHASVLPTGQAGDQAVGTNDKPLDNQALSITAVNVAVVAAFSSIWALCDGMGLGPFENSASAVSFIRLIISYLFVYYHYYYYVVDVE